MHFLHYCAHKLLEPTGENRKFRCPWCGSGALWIREPTAAGKERFYCYACSKEDGSDRFGDIYDLLKEVEGIEDYGERMKRVKQLRKQYDRRFSSQGSWEYSPEKKDKPYYDRLKSATEELHEQNHNAHELSGLRSWLFLVDEVASVYSVDYHDLLQELALYVYRRRRQWATKARKTNSARSTRSSRSVTASNSRKRSRGKSRPSGKN